MDYKRDPKSTVKDPLIRLKLTHMGLHVTFDGGEGGLETPGRKTLSDTRKSSKAHSFRKTDSDISP